MRYFRLIDEVRIPGRWHLGAATLVGGSALELMEGRSVSIVEEPQIELTEPGRALEFSLTSFAVPIATKNLAAAMASVAGTDLQALAVEISGHAGYQALNATRLIACVDEARSEFTKWTLSDHRADLVGQYRMVTKLRLDVSKLSTKSHVFRIEGWPVALIVSEWVKEAMERAGCFGAKFDDVT